MYVHLCGNKGLFYVTKKKMGNKAFSGQKSLSELRVIVASALYCRLLMDLYILDSAARMHTCKSAFLM